MEEDICFHIVTSVLPTNLELGLTSNFPVLPKAETLLYQLSHEEREFSLKLKSSAQKGDSTLCCST